MTPNELNEKAKQYIESLTDDYFENTPKYKLVKNAFVTGVFFAESCGKTIEKLEKENAELKAQIEKMKSFVKSMYEANKNDAYCKEYLGTILNEWELM